MRGYLLLLVAALLLGCAGNQQAEDPEAACMAACNGTMKACGNDGITYLSACHARCLGVEPAYEGACAMCNDSDGGKNRSVQGSVTTASAKQADYCADFYSVEEYYCQNGLMGRETIQCEPYEECRDGACGAPPPPEPAQECYDSDGKDPATMGVVNGSGSIYQDACEDTKRVKEFYCDGGLARHEIVACDAGFACEAGRCVRITGNCTDTDSGYDIYNEGKIVVKTGLVSAEYLDKCLDGYTVKEYYCSLGEFMSEEVACPQGYRCTQASCKEDLCTDSDEGYSIFRKGGTNKGKTLMKDFCTGPDSGVEYYCDQNRIVNSTFTCPAGYVCDDGRCYE